MTDGDEMEARMEPIDYVEFVVRVEAGLNSPEPGEAERALETTFEALGECLSGGEAEDLASELVSEFAEPLTRAGGKAESLSLAEFYERVAEKQGTGEKLAKDHVTAVFSALGRAVDSGELSDIRAQLPKEFQSLL